MISIVNIDHNPREKGMHLYEVRINRDPVARFTHLREDGLVKCLERAAIAVSWREKNWRNNGEDGKK